MKASLKGKILIAVFLASCLSAQEGDSLQKDAKTSGKEAASKNSEKESKKELEANQKAEQMQENKYKAVVASEGDGELKDLTPVITTANRTPTLITEAPGNVSYISEKTIKMQQNRQISSVLGRIAGVHVKTDVGYNGRPGIYMRGIPYGTLLMLDGVILNDLDGTYRVMQSIPTYDIGGIEIVRGPFSSLYGTGAMGGVINLISKKITKRDGQAIIGYGNEMVRGGAEKNLTRGYVSLGDVFFDKRLRVRASYAFNVSGGAYRVPAIASIPGGATGITATFTDGSPITNGAEVGWSGRNAYLTQYGRLRAEYDWNDYDTTTATLIITKISASQHDPISYLKGPNGGTVYGYGYETPGANGGSTPGYSNPFVGSGWIGFREEYNYIASVSHKHNFTENTSLDIILSSVTLNSQWADGCDGQDNCQAPGKNPTTQGQGSFMFGGNGTAMHNFATNNYFSAIINHKFNDRHLLLIGFQGRVDNANNSFSLTPNYRAKQFWKTYEPAYQDINFSVYTLAAFGNWQANWNKWVSTNMGLRLDYWKNYNISTFDRNNPHNPNLQTFKGVEEFFPSPKFAINITPHKYTTIKGSIGLAFHAPNTRQIFNNTDSGVFQVQNPALGPEYGLQFDIGIEQRNPYGGVAKVFYYQTEMYNGIFPSGLGTRQHPIKNLNGARSRFQGVEIEIEQKIYGGLYFMANYTYTRAILVKDPSQPENEGHQYPFIPRQMGGFSINYGDEGPGFYGSIQAQGQGVAYINFKNLPQHLAFGNITPRLLINIKAGWNFKNGTHISATFLNITNEKYYDYYRGSGASFYVEFGGKFF